jgi:hypothetical protein
VKIDLKRYGVPKIDQHKVPIPPTGQVAQSTSMVKMKRGVAMKADTTAASRRIETSKPPGKKKATARPVRKTAGPPARSGPGGT